MGAKAHSVLHFMISKAVLQGEESAHEISLSLHDLQAEHEEYGTPTDSTSIILKVKIQTSWDTSQELIDEKEFLGEEENDDEDPTSSGSKNTPSH